MPPISSRLTIAGRRAASLLTAFLAVASSQPASAEDSVYVMLGENVRSRARLTGEVLDYTGQRLVIRLPGNVERAFPTASVLQVETQKTAEHQAGDKLQAQRQPGPAIDQYRAALNEESRTWVRRQILSEMVWCYRELNDVPAAVQFFLLLLQSDPSTHYFEAIPLAWLPAEPLPGVDQLASQWMDRQDLPAAALLGASHLLSTAERPAALDRLKGLSFDSDPRIAWLARAQVWRVIYATASDGEVEAWAGDLHRMPDPLRPGPYFVLGQARAARHQPEQAALAFLRVPILYTRHRALAARALLEAGRELEEIGQKAEAATLYRELVESHPDTLPAREAHSRLEQLADKHQ